MDIGTRPGSLCMIDYGKTFETLPPDCTPLASVQDVRRRGRSSSQYPQQSKKLIRDNDPRRVCPSSIDGTSAAAHLLFNLSPIDHGISSKFERSLNLTFDNVQISIMGVGIGEWSQGVEESSSKKMSRNFGIATEVLLLVPNEYQLLVHRGTEVCRC